MIFYLKLLLEMIRRKTTICLILQDMFRIHHPHHQLLIQNKESVEQVYLYTIEQTNDNRYNRHKDNKGD